MRQDEINRDLKNYISVKKDKKFWNLHRSPVPKVKPKTDEEVNLVLYGDTHHKSSVQESISPISRKDKELEEIEAKVEEVNEVEQKVINEFDDEREGLMQKFFKKLNFSKEKEEDEAAFKIAQPSDNPDVTMDDAELRELLHGLHNWIIQLPADKLEKFKTSKEFELYTKYLRKHSLIK